MADKRIVTCECCGGDGSFFEGDQIRPQVCIACDGRGEYEVAHEPITVEDLDQSAPLCETMRRMRDLIQCMIDNDPEDLAADGGIRVIDVWREDAKRVIASTGPII